MRVCTPANADDIIRAGMWALCAGLIAVLAPADAGAQEAAHGGPGHHHGLHFTHPMIAESVSPDTKVRFDHQFFEFADGDHENSAVIEAEYAFHRSISLEVGLPYTYTHSARGNLDLKLKLANYAFEEAGILLGYGVGFAFPTNGDLEGDVHLDDGEEAGHHAELIAASRRGPAGGRTAAPAGPRRRPHMALTDGGGAGVVGTLGTDEYEIEPFVNLGFKRGRWELVAWTLFGIPFNQHEQDEVAADLSYSMSALFHASSRLQALLELDGAGGISGEAVGEDVVAVAPGIRFAPIAGQPLVLGVSAGFPLANEERFDTRIKASAFWHF